MSRAAARLDRAQVPDLYAIADAGVLGVPGLPSAVGTMADSGVRWIQLRAKEAGDADLCVAIEGCLERAEASGATIWLNDRPDLAALYSVQGVHLGQDDLPPEAARKVVGESTWIGLSTHDLDQVRAADADPAVDLVALGPIFATTSKANPDPVVGLEALSAARELTEKPLVAIGGVELGNLCLTLASGADSAVVLGAICKGDIASNSRRLLRALGSTHFRSDRLIYLTGFMGAGKSSVGRSLSDRLGVPLLDLDDEIEQRGGASISALFRRLGEDGFRELEAAVLESCSALEVCVVATGGGIVERAPNIDLMLRSGTVVWLDPDFSTLVGRLLAAPEGRPLFVSTEQALSLYESRLAGYRRCHLRVSVGADDTAEDVSDRLVDRLETSCAT